LESFGGRFKELRLEKKLTQQQLAEMFYTKKSSISRYENNLQIPEIDSLKKYADFFDVTVDYLLCRSDTKKIANNKLANAASIPGNTVKLPILGVVRAGEPLYAEQNLLGYSFIDSSLVPSSECFYLRVNGDSMNLSNIIDGQLVMIRRQNEVENGEIALVLVNDEEATIRKFYRSEDMVTLMPHSSNPNNPPRIISLSRERIKVIGRVVGTFIRF
jgi:repressor LexA